MSAKETIEDAGADLKASQHTEAIRGSMREFIEWLKETDDIIVVTEEVDPRNFELSSIVQHAENTHNKAVLFENVKGSDMPVVSNLYGTIHRCAMALGIEPTEEQIERFKDDPRGSPGSMAGMSKT